MIFCYNHNMKNVSGKNKYFSTYFKVNKDVLDNYGAYDINLIMDTPLFIDPFLLFNSKKPEYQKLHNEIVKYLIFLKDQARMSLDDESLKRHLKSYYIFPEVKECWLGFSKNGNEGAGLNIDFATTLYKGLNTIIKNVGEELISKGSHLEKLCLIGKLVDIDKISDFTANLIKGYLLNFTQAFAEKYIDRKYCKKFLVDKSYFNYTTKSFVAEYFYLPAYRNNGKEEFVLLTPIDILRNDRTWINKQDLYSDYQHVLTTIPSGVLRYNLETYFRDTLIADEKGKIAKEQIEKSVDGAIAKYPELLDYYIKYKEDNGDKAVELSSKQVDYSNAFANINVERFTNALLSAGFYQKHSLNSFEESIDAVKYIKQAIEVNGLWRNFYDDANNPMEREEDLNRMFRLCFRKSQFLYNEHVDNGNGVCDAQVSYGSEDCTIVEFKLAKSSSLKSNLERQTEAYMLANNTDKGIKVVIYFSEKQLNRAQSIIKELDLTEDINKTIFLIDARNDNKVSASKLK